MSKMIEMPDKDRECGLSPKSGFIFGMLAGVAVAVAGAAAVVCAVKLKEKLEKDAEGDFIEISTEGGGEDTVLADCPEESEETAPESEETGSDE